MVAEFLQLEIENRKEELRKVEKLDAFSDQRNFIISKFLWPPSFLVTEFL